MARLIHCRNPLLLLCLFCFFSFMPAVSQAEGKVLAVAGEINIIDSYVQSVVDYYESAGYYTSKEDYVNEAIRIKLLALQAEKLGLEPYPVSTEHWDYDPDNQSNAELLSDLELATAYTIHEVRNFQVDQSIIESYYRAHPDQFREGPWGGAEAIPLDKDLAERIRARILNTMKEQIIDDIYLEVRDTYGIEILY